MTATTTTRRPTHGRLRWMRKTIKWVIVIVVVLLALALLAGAIAKRDLRAEYPAPGQMVDIGGYRLHLDCQGVGSPTVVMEAGLAEFSTAWALVQPQLAATTQVCVYDRAGLGWSDPSPNPRTAEPMVAELHSLLTNANIPGPYILVGHSTGGMLMRLYAHNYASEVVGMVLVDSQHEAQFERLSEPLHLAVERAFAKSARMVPLSRTIAASGLGALYPAVFANPMLPSPAREASAALLVMGPKIVEAQGAETKSIFASLVEVRAAQITTLGDIPLVVVSRGIFGGNWSVPGMTPDEEQLWWEELQADLVALSSQGRLVLAENSGHSIQLDEPELVIDAINQVLALVRN